MYHREKTKTILECFGANVWETHVLMVQSADFPNAPQGVVPGGCTTCRRWIVNQKHNSPNTFMQPNDFEQICKKTIFDVFWSNFVVASRILDAFWWMFCSLRWFPRFWNHYRAAVAVATISLKGAVVGWPILNQLIHPWCGIRWSISISLKIKKTIQNHIDISPTWKIRLISTKNKSNWITYGSMGSPPCHQSKWTCCRMCLDRENSGQSGSPKQFMRVLDN